MNPDYAIGSLGFKTRETGNSIKRPSEKSLNSLKAINLIAWGRAIATPHECFKTISDSERVELKR